MSKLTYEELEQERNELAAQVELLKHERDEALAYIENLKTITDCLSPRAEGEGVTIRNADGEDWRKAIMLRPPEALATLKAQWQAEFADEIRRAKECPGQGKCDDQGCPAHYATGGR